MMARYPSLRLATPLALATTPAFTRIVIRQHTASQRSVHNLRCNWLLCEPDNHICRRERIKDENVIIFMCDAGLVAEPVYDQSRAKAIFVLIQLLVEVFSKGFRVREERLTEKYKNGVMHRFVQEHARACA